MYGRSDQDPGPLVFLHMQRCGGSALTRFLELRFDNRRILNVNLLHREGDRIVGITGHTGAPMEEAGDLARFGLITGHNHFDDVDAIVRNPVYIALLRNPVDRVVSLYRYWRSHRADFIEAHDLRGPRLARELPLDDFVESDQPEAAYNVDNGMARQLVNRMLVPLDMTHDECLETASAALARFRFVGVTELLDLSVALLCRTLCWKTPAPVDRVNTYAQNLLDKDLFEPIEMEPVGPQTAARIMERNWVDAQLHQQALRSLDRTFHGPDGAEATPSPFAGGRRPTLSKRVARRLARMLTDYVHPP